MKIIAHACPEIVTIKIWFKKLNNYDYVYAKYYNKNILLSLYMLYIHQLLKS